MLEKLLKMPVTDFLAHPLFPILQGATVALIFAIAIIAITIFSRRQWLSTAIILVLITPLVLIGFWYSTGTLGISDWDYYFSYHENIRRTVIDHNQLPHWNPWTCGGTAGLADPEFPLFAPTFLPELLFGIPTGFRLAIFLSVATTAIGMLLLAKRLRFSVYAALLAAIGVSFGSVNLLEIVEGHPNIFSVMWLPWVLWAWLAAYRSQASANNAGIRLWPMVCGIFLALIFYQGGIYLLSYTAVSFLVLLVLVHKPMAALITSLKSGLWALGFAALKLIPVVLWLRQFQDTAYASSANTIKYLHLILLGRYLHGAGDLIPNQGSGWHEYGAYLGPVILTMALIGLFHVKKSRLVRSLAIAAILAILLSASGPFLKPIFDQLPFIPRSNISRTILFAVIPLSLLAGLGLDFLTSLLPSGKRDDDTQKDAGGAVAGDPVRAKFRGAPSTTGEAELKRGTGWIHRDRTRDFLKTFVATTILFLAALDLFTLAYSLSEQAFVLPAPAQPIPAAPSPIAYSTLAYQTRHQGHDYTRAYAATLQGYGSLTYCSVLSPEPRVRTIHDESDNSVISLSNKDANFELRKWSPNKTQVHIITSKPTDVILNTNFASGWHVNNHPTKEIAGRPGISINAGTHYLEFRYQTPGFYPGLTITLATTLLAFLLLYQHLSPTKTHSNTPQVSVPPHKS